MQPSKAEETDVIILCGGFGTRLASETQDRPKPMVDINGRPFLDILINHVSSYGFTRIILCTGYKSQYIEDYYHSNRMGLSFLISEEKTPLGTGGAIKNAENLIQSDSFIALNGDSFCPISFKKFYEFHQGKKSQLSLALTYTEKTADFGSVRLDHSSKILGFDEKTSKGKPGLVNSGIYLFNTNLLAEIESGEINSLEYDFFPSLIGKEIFGYVTDSRLLDVGTPERLSIARNLLV
jgi:D-glycero-alpha-D-manno-heptose 1-phosphate guanylyltransferase